MLRNIVCPQVQVEQPTGDRAQAQQTAAAPSPQTASSLAGDSDSDDDTRPTLTSQDVLSLVLSFSLRHGLSNAAVSDLVDLLKIVKVSDCELVGSRYLLMKDMAHRLNRQTIHYYCMNDACMAYIDKADDMCSECTEPFSAKKAKQSGRYFLHASIEEQVKELLESGFVERNLVTSFEREPGQRLYSDVIDGELYKSHRLLGRKDLSHLSLTWNFDGIQMHRSSNKTMWPILATMNELSPDVRKEKMLIGGIWYGPKKPLWSTFSRPFVDEMSKLSSTGIQWTMGSEERNSKVIPLLVMCDAPARCMVQALRQFNGAHGCTWCLQEGCVVPRGGGFCRVYPFEPDAERRTHDSVVECARTIAEGGDGELGVTGASRLLLLPATVQLDIVKSFPVDYMHCVLLGVTRQFHSLWFDSTSSHEVFSIRKCQQEVDSELEKIRPPSDLSRLPRASRATASRWTATEWRNWLLYYSLPLLSGRLPSRLLKHWSLLVAAVFALLSNRVSEASVCLAEKQLEEFVSRVGQLYGREHMTYNVHTLLHLGDTVRNCGPLWACSMFPFEGFNRTLVKFCTGSTYIAEQILDKFFILQMLGASRDSRKGDGDVNEPVERLVSRWLSGCTPAVKTARSVEGVVGLNTPLVRHFTQGEARLLSLSGYPIGVGKLKVRFFCRVIINERISCTAEKSNGKRNSSLVQTKQGICHLQKIAFVTRRGVTKCLAFCTRCESQRPFSSADHIMEYVPTGVTVVLEPSDIIGNCVDVQVGGGRVRFCCLQPNNIEKD